MINDPFLSHTLAACNLCGHPESESQESQEAQEAVDSFLTGVAGHVGGLGVPGPLLHDSGGRGGDEDRAGLQSDVSIQSQQNLWKI